MAHRTIYARIAAVIIAVGLTAPAMAQDPVWVRPQPGRDITGNMIYQNLQQPNVYGQGGYQPNQQQSQPQYQPPQQRLCRVINGFMSCQ